MLIKLDEANNIRLSNDELKLLETAKTFCAWYGRPYIKDIDELKISELPQWVLKELPNETNVDNIINQLKNIKLPFYKGAER